MHVETRKKRIRTLSEQRSTWTRPLYVPYRFRLALLRVATVPLPLPAIDALEPVLFRPFFVGDAPSVWSGESDDAVESRDDLRAGVFTSDGSAFALPFAAVPVAAALPGAVDLALDFDLVEVAVGAPTKPELLVRSDEREGSGAIASSSSSSSSMSVSSSTCESVWCPCSSFSSSINAPGIL